MLGVSLLNMLTLFAYGKPDWKPLLVGYLGLLAARRLPAGDRDVHLHLHQESDRRRRGRLRVCLLLWVLNWVSVVRTVQRYRRVIGYLSVHGALRIVFEGCS